MEIWHFWIFDGTGMVLSTLENPENLEKSGNFVKTSKINFILVLNLKKFRAARDLPVYIEKSTCEFRWNFTAKTRIKSQGILVFLVRENLEKSGVKFSPNSQMLHEGFSQI